MWFADGRVIDCILSSGHSVGQLSLEPRIRPARAEIRLIRGAKTTKEENKVILIILMHNFLYGDKIAGLHRARVVLIARQATRALVAQAVLADAHVQGMRQFTPVAFFTRS